MGKILVTGGLGYIGSHTVVELIQAGYEVVIVDNLNNSRISVLDGIANITGVKPAFYPKDICDRNALNTVFNENAIDAVIHFAAYKAVGESVEEPLKYYMNNVGGLLSLLAEMEAFNVQRLVFSSSCTVYGQPDSLPVSEEAPIQKAESPYGDTKIQCEKILETLPNMNSIALRYFNPIGAHESGLIGELPLGIPNNLIPFITQSAAGLRGPLTVYGDDYNTKDGTCIRDYIHVDDLAKAHVKALEYVCENSCGFEPINIGTGNGTTVMEVIDIFNEISEEKVKFTIGDRRSGDIEQVWAEANKAEELLGWSAKKSLREMVQSSWNWQKNIQK